VGGKTSAAAGLAPEKREAARGVGAAGGLTHHPPSGIVFADFRGRAGEGEGVSDGRESAMSFTGVKVFSATKAKEREELGETVTRWLRSNADLEIVDRVVTQSSDDEFHCLSIVLFFRPKT
jgi:hypothetical protein